MMIFQHISIAKIPSVVATVDLNRYKGTWYEIARLPNFFERKLKCITAIYTLHDDGKIKVVNGGHYLTEPEKISTATGVHGFPIKTLRQNSKFNFSGHFQETTG